MVASPPSTTAPVTAESSPQDASGTPALLGQSLEALTAWVQEHGQPAYRGKQLHQLAVPEGVRSLQDITVFPKAWRQSLEHVAIGRSELHCAPSPLTAP
jgi:23S rRNA (adenine2503-C2)-methyltransferase